MTDTISHLYGWTLWPIVDDDGNTDYWDIHEPCGIHNPRRACDCAAGESAAAHTAPTLAAAKAIVRSNSPHGWRTTLTTHALLNGRLPVSRPRHSRSNQ